jgi:hypothetical protein
MPRRLTSLAAAVVVLASSPLWAQTYDRGVQQASIQTGSGRIAYILAGRLWIGDLGKGTGTVVPITGDRSGSPVLSPDGRELVHLEWTDGFRRTLIRHRRTDTRAATDVIGTTRDVGEVIDAHFARRRVVFSVNGDGLFEVDIAGGEPRRITRGGTDRSPRYSSDGRRVAFVRTVGEAQDLYVLSLDDGSVRRVQSSVSAGEMFDWSPDDQQFVFESFDTGAMELWTLPAAGGAARRITDHVAQDHWPSWAADGFIYVHRERRLQRIDPRSHASTPVTITSHLPPVAPATLVVRGARVLDVVTGTWMPAQDITITAGTIVAMEPSASRPEPSGARVIDASDRYVIPGLIDMHVHYRAWMGPLMDRFGVSVMRDMGSDPGVDWILDERQFANDGHAGAPRIMVAGPVVNGSGAGRIGQVLTERLDVLHATIAWLADVGVDHIKIGSENTEATLGAILDTARARSLQVWGHIALVPARRAIAMGQHGIEHLRGIGWAALGDRDLPVPVPRRLTGMRREAAAWWDVSDEELRALAKHMVGRKVGWDPTLTVMRTFSSTTLPEEVRSLLPPAVLTRWDRSRDAGPLPGWAAEDSGAFDKAVASQEIFLRAYHAAGGPLLTGSDVGPEFVVPGLAVHQEMARFVSMGVTPIDALRAATINGARALSISDRAGSLAPGRWGDLLILEADPLVDITATQRIRTVVRRGRVVHDLSRAPSSR